MLWPAGISEYGTDNKSCVSLKVVQEVVAALNTAKYDDSSLVLFGGIGNVFSSGTDLHFLVTGDRRVAARQMADALRYGAGEEKRVNSTNDAASSFDVHV